MSIACEVSAVPICKTSRLVTLKFVKKNVRMMTGAGRSRVELTTRLPGEGSMRDQARALCAGAAGLTASTSR